MSDEESRRESYGRIWDTYVKEVFPRIQSADTYSKKELLPWRVLNTADEHYEWPGDEWGDEESALRILSESLGSALEAEPRCLCEFGAGAGRYTELVLGRYKSAKVYSFDVSSEFETKLRERCAHFVKDERLVTCRLDDEPLTFLAVLKGAGLLGEVDAVYSFDAMVHVDLHTLIVYWASATRALRPGGVLAMNVADATSRKGFMKLLHDAPAAFRRMGSAGGHFMWISPDIVRETLDRLGYEVTFTGGNDRDSSFSAKLVDPARAARWFEEAGAGWLNI